jgi:hypothetical protein
MLCNVALMVRLSNFYSSFKPNFSRIFCSSFKLFENQTVRLSRTHCIRITKSESEGSLYIIAQVVPVHSIKVCRGMAV